MQRNRIIGAILIGGSLGLFTAAMLNLGHKPEVKTVAKPAEATLRVNYPMPGPAVVAAPAAAQTEQWQHFQCRRGTETLSDFKQARAEFMGRRNNRVYWRVFTPANNTPETAHNFNVNPSRIVCSYVKS